VLKIILGVRDTTPSWWCVMWEECGPYSSTGFVPQCIFTVLWPTATALLPNMCYMLTCDWAPGLITASLPVFFQPWLVWNKSKLKKKLRNCDLNFVVVIRQKRHLEFWTPYSDAWLPTRAQLVVCTAPQKGPGYPSTYIFLDLPCHSQCCPFQTACPYPSL